MRERVAVAGCSWLWLAGWLLGALLDSRALFPGVSASACPPTPPAALFPSRRPLSRTSTVNARRPLPACLLSPFIPCCRAYDSVASSSRETWDQAKGKARQNWEATKDKSGEVRGHPWLAQRSRAQHGRPPCRRGAFPAAVPPCAVPGALSGAAPCGVAPHSTQLHSTEWQRLESRSTCATPEGRLALPPGSGLQLSSNIATVGLGCRGCCERQAAWSIHRSAHPPLAPPG